MVFERKGIKTDLMTIERYIHELHGEVAKGDKVEFLQRVFSPIRRNALESLSQLQNSEIGSYEHFEADTQDASVFNLNMYLELERQRKEGREKRLVEQAKPEEERKKEAMLSESEHIHNKALFDCVNESPHQFR